MDRFRKETHRSEVRDQGLTIEGLAEGLVDVLEAADDVRERRRGPEVLLLRAELLTDYMRTFSTSPASP